MKLAMISSVLVLILTACSQGSFNPQSSTESDNSGVIAQTQLVFSPNDNPLSNNPPQLEMLPTITPQNRYGELVWNYPFYPINLPGDYDYEIRQFFPYNFFQTQSESRFYYPSGYAHDLSNFYFPSVKQYVISVDLNSGEVAWQSELQGYVLGVSENTVFILTSEERIYGLDKKTGTEKWTIYLELLFDEDDYFSYYPQLIQHSGKNILPIEATCPNSLSLRFLSIDENTGVTVLTPCYPEVDESLAPLIVLGDQVFAADQSFYNLNSEDGSVNWKIDSPGKVSTSLDNLNILSFDFGKGILYYYIGSIYLKDIYAIDIYSGKSIWPDGLLNLNGMKSDHVSGQYYSVEKYIVLDNYDEGYVFIFDKENGKLINSIEATRRHEIIVAENGFILYYHEIGVFVGIDYISGVELWKNDEIEIYDNPLEREKFLCYQDIVIIPDSDQNLMAIDQKTGSILWVKEINKNEKFGIEDGNLVYYNEEKLELVDIFSGTSKVIDLDNMGFPHIYGDHVEKVSKNSWIICGHNLIMVLLR